MHHVRGLVRPVAGHVLKQLEKVGSVHSLKDCFRTVELRDSAGGSCVVPLLHPAALMTSLERLSSEKAAQLLQDALSALRDGQKPSGALGEEVVPLYIKGTSESCRDEIQQRERRFILKLQGRQLATDPDAMRQFVEKLVGESSYSEREDDESRYYGLLEALCTSDPRTAIALGVNNKLPHLNETSASCLANLVEIETPSAITTFLSLVAEKDALVAAHERCATLLAARVRQAAPQNLHIVLENALTTLDPAVVFPTSAERIQSLTVQQLNSGAPTSLEDTVDCGLSARAEAVTSLRRRGKWLPKRVAMTALSAICLTDLERPWLREAMAQRPGANGGTASPGHLGEATPTGRAARSLALKDVRRNLVDNRLLHEYASLLRDGYISAHDADSFPAFLEECGECHASRDRPATIEFTVSPATAWPRADGLTLRDALVRLAPGCSYWCTLIDAKADHVRAWAAPCGDVRVSVALPAAHECSAVLEDEGFVKGLPPEWRAPPILWEDEHVFVVNKPAGIATSRHALSATQSGRLVTDLLSCVAHTRPGMRGVFREGQVHRLDTGTSGCLLFAKSAAAAASLRHQMGTSAAYSHFSKTYLALCAVLEPDLAAVPLKGILRDRADSKIQTAYRVVQFFAEPRVALVECRLQQGKKHQVRRHLASAGLPLLGDVDHGGASCCHPLLSRVALHAKSLSFVHPVSGLTVSVSAPDPPDFQHSIERLSTHVMA